MLFRSHNLELAQWFGCLQSAGIHLCGAAHDTLSLVWVAGLLWQGYYALPPSLLGAALWFTDRKSVV